MPKVNHFELPADDPKRAIKFYTDVFGWKIDKWGPEDYWLVTAGPEDERGADGAIQRRKDAIAPYVLNTIGVSSIDDSLKKVTKAGGKVMRPKTNIPGIGDFAYCQDTEGTIFGIIQPIMPTDKR